MKFKQSDGQYQRIDSPSKSDPKDALVITDVVSRGYYYDYSRHAIVFQRLQTIAMALARVH